MKELRPGDGRWSSRSLILQSLHAGCRHPAAVARRAKRTERIAEANGRPLHWWRLLDVRVELTPLLHGWSVEADHPRSRGMCPAFPWPKRRLLQQSPLDAWFDRIPRGPLGDPRCRGCHYRVHGCRDPFLDGDLQVLGDGSYLPVQHSWSKAWLRHPASLLLQPAVCSMPLTAVARLTETVLREKVQNHEVDGAQPSETSCSRNTFGELHRKVRDHSCPAAYAHALRPHHSIPEKGVGRLPTIPARRVQELAWT